MIKLPIIVFLSILNHLQSPGPAVVIFTDPGGPFPTELVADTFTWYVCPGFSCLNVHPLVSGATSLMVDFLASFSRVRVVKVK